MMMKDRIRTHLESDKPTTTMAATGVLLSLTVLPEMHVKMFLHVLFTQHRIRKSDATLFTLNRQTTINKRNIWTTSKVCTIVSDAAGEDSEDEDVPIYVRRVELDILREYGIPVYSILLATGINLTINLNVRDGFFDMLGRNGL